MERTEKLANAIGLAMKAGKLKSGDFVVEKLVRAGKARLVLMDETTARNSAEKYERLCLAMDVERILVAELGQCIGKPGRMLAAVEDENFSNMIRNAAQIGVVPKDSNDRG